MKAEELYKLIDHTALQAPTTWDEIRELCQEAMVFRMASVCVPTSYVKAVHENFPAVRISAVVGFPLGNANTASKVSEAKQAVADGADEIDMVINVGFAKSGWMELVENEIARVREVTESRILKVILETCYLTEDEKIALCGVVSRTGADFIKTSTGFGPAGATLEDIRLMREHLDEKVKIKAAGGIRSREEMEQYIEAGASRIGTSRAIDILS